ncbi:MAG: thioredoxin family protein [Flavobacteriales bacterium]|nr:thioredoxin family protein [Flavobacteriales bacterium]MDG1781860.1 thioredoxin family protein [Flavobacteriales bacterium]MDG2246667.1 thioredoxin family protein [Flavobacteriales bacterium]
MENTLAYVKSGMPGSMTYDEYFTLMNTLVDEGKTTGENQNEAFVKYTFLNRHRMNRLNKTVKLREDLQQAVSSIDEPMTWLVLSEAWCGDAAQNLPVINQVAQLNEHISLRVILRDENLSIMDELLTNGGRSIPKLVALNAENEVVFQWGPRPAPVQEMVNAYKAMPEPKKPYSEFTEEVQKWYAVDKTATMQAEFLELLVAV